MTYAYDDAARLTGITQSSSTVGFTYDAASRRTKLTLPNGIDVDYVYDDAGQLTSLTCMQGSTPLGDLAYTYDGAGQRTAIGGSYARTNLPAAITSATHDANNRLTDWGGTAYTYDDNGNLTSDGTRTYNWDVRNRLSSLSGGASGSFTYDATGRRQSKTVSGTTTKFLYDGLNVIQELDGSLTPTANLLVGLGFDETFIRTDSAARYLLPDASGSTLALTDGSAATRTSYTYEPYGETTSSGDASTNAFQYTGRENDNTGLYYYRARYYQPGIKRFVSEDPIGLAGGLNLYAYVGGDPISLRDPTGNFGIIPIAGIVITAAVTGITLYAIYDCVLKCKNIPYCPPPDQDSTISEYEQIRKQEDCRRNCYRSFGGFLDVHSAGDLTPTKPGLNF